METYLDGLEFLQLPEEQWPEVETEQRNVKIILNVALTKIGEVMNIKKFSSW